MIVFQLLWQDSVHIKGTLEEDSCRPRNKCVVVGSSLGGCCGSHLCKKTAAAVGALQSTTLPPYWLLPFTGALVSGSIPLPAKALPALWALHLALWLVTTGLLLVVLLQPLAVGLTPAHPRAGCLMPFLLWDPYSLQIPTNQISLSPLRSPWWPGLGQPAKQCLLWQSMVWHPSYMPKPLKPSPSPP